MFVPTINPDRGAKTASAGDKARITCQRHGNTLRRQHHAPSPKHLCRHTRGFHSNHTVKMFCCLYFCVWNGEKEVDGVSPNFKVVWRSGRGEGIMPIRDTSDFIWQVLRKPRAGRGHAGRAPRKHTAPGVGGACTDTRVGRVSNPKNENYVKPLVRIHFQCIDSIQQTFTRHLTFTMLGFSSAVRRLFGIFQYVFTMRSAKYSGNRVPNQGC